LSRDGDYYVDIATLNVYQKRNGVWTFIANWQTTTGGSSLNYHQVSVAGANAANVKASAGRVVGWNLFNNAGYPVYVKLHDTASTPTPGTGVVSTIGVQAGMSAPFSSTTGIPFASGIGISIVRGITDSDATPISVNDCVVDLEYI